MMDGVREEPTEFRRDDVFAGTERFRRVAGTGPVYEILSIHGQTVTAQMIDEDEQTFEYPLVDAQADPRA